MKYTRRLAGVVVLQLMVSSLLGAQNAAPVAPAAPVASALTPTTERTVDGRVRRPVASGGDSTGMGAAAGSWVTLHRVGKDKAGPVDSVRSNATGHFRMRWTPSGAADAVYFASVTWGGVAYFTAPLRTASARGDEAEITVFDTTSRTYPLTVKGRHLIIGKADSSKTRTVIEVFELSNDSLRTLIASEGTTPRPTWTVAVPQAAQDVRVTQGEITPDAFTYAAGRVSVFAPIAPGLKQVAFSYKLALAAFPIQVRAERGAVVFEILIEEPQGAVFGAGFAAVEPVNLENRNFRRFLAQDVKEGIVTTIELPSGSATGRNLYIAGLLVAIGFLMLLVLSRAMQRRASASADSTMRAMTVPGFSRVAPVLRVLDAPMHERLAQEISALDATFAKQASSSASMQQAYDARRAELKEALADALADALASPKNAR